MKTQDEIDNYLADDLHSDLADEEQNALHVHLVECASCRRAHQESKIMNKVLEEKFANEKPDIAFEQRMLAGFRNRVPNRSGAIKTFVVALMRFRASQVAAVAAVLLALVQVGRMITHEGAVRNEFVSAELQERSDEAKDKIAPASGGKVGAFSKSAAVSSYASRNAPGNNPALADATLAQPEVQPEFHEESAPPSLMSVPAPRAKSASIDEKESEAPATAVTANRKLIRNAQVELEIISFDDAVQKITAFANEDRGYIATTRSEKQANGKLKGQIVVKVLPENLDRFLQKLRRLGEFKNQTLATED